MGGNPAGVHNSYVEIDLDAVTQNYRRVQAHVGREVGIIPVLKANAYGHGTVAMARHFAGVCGVRLLAVGHLVEALEIRQAGLSDVAILVMGGLLPWQMAAAARHDIQFALFDPDAARALSEAAGQQGKRARVQVKVETGFGRIGVRPGPPLAQLLDTVAALGNIEITGLYTHFATAERVGDPFVAEQHGRFLQAQRQIEGAGIRPQYVHCCNTGAVVWFREGFGTHVRAGCVVMGYPSMADFSNPLGVAEPLSWRTAIVHIARLEPGESCGYGRHFVADRPMRVATIGVGYGDGLYRPLVQQGGPVIVNDTRTRYLAACMDMSLVDVTGIDCRVGDAVTLMGVSRGGARLSTNELARLTGQTPSSPMVGIHQRVRRLYVGGLPDDNYEPEGLKI